MSLLRHTQVMYTKPAEWLEDLGIGPRLDHLEADKNVSGEAGCLLQAQEITSSHTCPGLDRTCLQLSPLMPFPGFFPTRPCPLEVWPPGMSSGLKSLPVASAPSPASSPGPQGADSSHACGRRVSSLQPVGVSARAGLLQPRFIAS